MKKIQRGVICPRYLEQVAKAVVKGVMRPDRKLKGFLRVKAK